MKAPRPNSGTPGSSSLRLRGWSQRAGFGRTAVAHLDLWVLSLKQRQRLKGNPSCGRPALTPGWELPEPSCCPGLCCSWAGTARLARPQCGPGACCVLVPPQTRADRMSPPYHGLRWGSSLDPQLPPPGQGPQPWLPVFTRQLRRQEQLVRRPWVRSAVRSSGQSGDGGKG